MRLPPCASADLPIFDMTLSFGAYFLALVAISTITEVSTMWHEQTHNPAALQQLYYDTTGLDEVVLMEAQIDVQLRRVRLRLELARFPDKPARTWDRRDNAVQVTLDCWLSDTAGDVELRVTGSIHECSGRLSITPDGAVMTIAFESKDAMLRAQCHTVRIDRFSAYQRGEAEN